ncbi:MAG TPA: uroporphyrinogen decarboxylase [Acidimicrobiia bacterium]|nr:uroporphyrinogen decarboxylase [Acidimicrobiia bacterium]
MSSRLLKALARQPLDRPPVWIMRQAGRYLPEYRDLRQRHSFQEAVSTPVVAAEITLQPLHRFPFDGAVIFADIMTPLEAMGVEMTFDPGPRLEPMSLAQVAALPDLDPSRLSFVGETIERVRASLAGDVAVVGFAGAPLTLLAYLIEGGGSKEFLTFRSALRRETEVAREALGKLATAMNSYLRMQAEAGADVVQLFDTWAGLLDVELYADLAVSSSRTSLTGLPVPRIYFAPGASHTLAVQPAIDADAYGIDWRISITKAWKELGDTSVQGNLDPAVLLTDPDRVHSAVVALLDEVGGRVGHVVNLGHGIDRHTPVENVAALVEAVRSYRG